MIFYYAIQTVSVASQIALEEAGAEYEERLIEFRTTEQQSEKYLQVNPKGRVPALVTDQGIITETPAILGYIAQSNPAANLAPLHDPFQFAKMQEFNNYLCSTVHVNHAHKMRGSRWVEEDDEQSKAAMAAKVSRTMHDSFNLIENDMFVGPWVLGKDFSICDCYVFCISNWLVGDEVDIKDFPQIYEHHLRMRDRPAVQKVMAVHGL